MLNSLTKLVKFTFVYSIAHVFFGDFLFEHGVKRFFQSLASSKTIDRDILESIGNPCVHDARIFELFSHFGGDFAACDPVFDPEFADPGIRMGKGQVLSGFRVSEESRVEIKSGFLFFCPVDPGLEMSRCDFVSGNSFFRIQIDGVDIESLFTGNQGKCFFEILAEFRGSACASGIISRTEDNFPY